MKVGISPSPFLSFLGTTYGQDIIPECIPTGPTAPPNQHNLIRQDNPQPHRHPALGSLCSCSRKECQILQHS